MSTGHQQHAGQIGKVAVPDDLLIASVLTQFTDQRHNAMAPIHAFCQDISRYIGLLRGYGTMEAHNRSMLRLKFVFGSCAVQALDLVDKHSVTCLSSPSGRKAFQVMGGSGRLYTCFTSCHYCPCPAFAYTVLRRNEGLLCKHLLGVYLSQAMGLTQQESISDQDISTLLAGGATAS
ncbi:Zinc finger SWIM domain-containing protein 7 [Merluccius polli]|uniref:Zinc finger SWIM domain-containing protein 7 n=1 Tax=Merluccius polli TaxID=89951 RepID=A0AA47NN56_MERPO|nr:Zinc finger SWIM domain-containing protein 7 [Merluccius polli]